MKANPSSFKPFTHVDEEEGDNSSLAKRIPKNDTFNPPPVQ